VNSTFRKPAKSPQLFTVERANAALPLVRAIVSDLVELSQEVTERRRRLSLLKAGRNLEVRDLYSEELVQIEEELEKDNRRLREYVQELRQLGVEPTDGHEGIVDFPAMLDGRTVYLCWKLGEPEVRYWHEPGSGYRDRKPLAARSGPAPSMTAGCNRTPIA